MVAVEFCNIFSHDFPKSTLRPAPTVQSECGETTLYPALEIISDGEGHCGDGLQTDLVALPFAAAFE